MFSDDLFLKEIIFLGKELDNKQRVIETLSQKISENARRIHLVKNTTFSNDVDVTNKCKFMKDCVKNAIIRFSKEKTSEQQSSSKLINGNTIEKSALITEKINIQLDDVRKESRRTFYESKEKKEKTFSLKPNTQSLKMQDQIQ